jgi:hypothetical protein
MVAPRNKPPARSVARLDPEQRRALQMLANSGPSGLTEAILLSHGFSIELLVDITRADLAAVMIGNVRAGLSMITVVRLRITEAGLKAIQDA